jgi:RNA polymerase sigma-70 factor, ECF subfamily
VLSLRGTTASIGGRSLETTARQDTDVALAARARSGDVGAFGELVKKHERAICGVVCRMVANRDDVDDIVQEVFVNAFRCLASFKGEAAFSTWLYRIAVNTSIKQMKKIKVRQATSIDDPLSGLAEALVSKNGDAPESAAERRERNEAIRQAVLMLNEKHRAVVVLHYFEDLSCDEVAKIMGCSVGTVWSRLHYACRKLQAQLDWLTADS